MQGRRLSRPGALLAFLVAVVPTTANESAPGLALTFRSLADGRTDTRIARMAALSLPEGASPTPFLSPGPFSAEWTGWLKLEAPQRVRFGLALRGTARLFLDEKPIVFVEKVTALTSVRMSEEVLIPAGRRKFRLNFEVPKMGDPFVRLYWQGADFFVETVPPTVFRYDPSDALTKGVLLRQGRVLMARHRCLDCHFPEADFLDDATCMPELFEDTPSLAEVGSRVNKEWLAYWLDDPRRFRPESSMPRVFSVGKTGGELDPGVWDVTAYLMTFRSEESKDAKSKKPPLSGDAKNGQTLYEDLGCAVCHLLEASRGNDPLGRVTLEHVNWKWKPGEIAAFLRRPHQRYKANPMPDFRLADNEAVDLEIFLRAKTPPPPAIPLAPAGDIERGEELAEELGCFACHGPLDREPLDVPELPGLEDVDWSGSGCVSDGARPADARFPDFGLSPSERRSIRAFRRGHLSALNRRSLAEYANRQVERLRCYGCHGRDGQPSLRSDKPAPALTFVGDQFHLEWTERVVAGTLEYRMRPWLKARMPSFPAHAQLIAKGLALDHGRSLRSTSDVRSFPTSVAAGEQLIGAKEGFACGTCHPIGGVPPQVQLDVGVIDLVHARERLLEEFFLRWMTSPQRIEEMTKMPAYADAAGRSVLGGNAEEQFRAIWAFLALPRK